MSIDLGTPPLPPLAFQELVCGPSYAYLFEDVGRGMVNHLEYEGLLAGAVDFLDVGCGCGRVARYLMERPLRSYVGFDRHPGMVDWCRTEIARRDPRFRFDLFDLKSAYDDWDAQRGTLDVVGFTFPYADASFDTALLASVFTHMPTDETRHYLAELHRVLRPGGRMLLSIFFTEHEPSRLDHVNFLHDPSVFQATVDALGFDARLAQREITYGYTQNWYVLTKAR